MDGVRAQNQPVQVQIPVLPCTRCAVWASDGGGGGLVAKLWPPHLPSGVASRLPAVGPESAGRGA